MNITYEEFLNKISDAKIGYNTKTEIDDINEKMFVAPVPSFYEEKWHSKTKPKFDFIIQYWRTGGVRGGSCWDNSDPKPYSTTDETPKSFEDLDKILEAVYPSISFLKYKKIENLIRTGEATDYQYYGNRDDYQYRYIDLKGLFWFLTEN